VNSGLSPSQTEIEAVSAPVGRRKYPMPLRWGLACAFAVALSAGFLVVERRGHPSVSPIRPSATPSGNSYPTLRLTGKTEAVQSRAILAPLVAGQQVGTLTIIKLIPSGSRVKRGDLLAEFDRQAQLRDSIDKKAQSDDQNGKVLEAQATEAAARSKDETDIQTAQSALSKAELEMQKVELLSRIDAEKAREDLEEARATLAQLKDTFDLKRKAAQASIRILEIQRDRTRETMLHAQNNAALMQILSPIDGIVVFARSFHHIAFR